MQKSFVAGVDGIDGQPELRNSGQHEHKVLWASESFSNAAKSSPFVPSSAE